MNDAELTIMGFLVGAFVALAGSIHVSNTTDTPVAKDIAHIQSAITVCNEHGLQPYSTDHKRVTCSNGKTYILE